mmetsp:Transcript_19509/g.64693  ORF Transcript_19509/g.64693 Transcript_19509/m.64693 type:complete len:357 (-) Transcript_19509:3501-4571(-)
MPLFVGSNVQARSQKNGYGLKNPAGVGIVFKSGPDEALFVKAVAEGGPAAASGKIHVNDCLLKVDGEDVYRQPIERVVKYILGEPGSEISMTFQRFSGDKVTKFTVKMKRGQTAVIKSAAPEPDEVRNEQLNDNVKKIENLDNKLVPKESVLKAAAAAKGMSLEEKQQVQQQRISERLARMKEMKEIVAMSYTGRSHVEDQYGTYEGDIVDGKKQGKGIMKYRNGDIYTGAWKNNMMNGEGTMVYTNGEKYHGEWINDRRNGKGTHHFKDTSRYEGEFFNDDMHGLGTFYYQNGSVYQGQWLENRRDGCGVLTGANGNSFHGQWHQDKKHGNGVVHYSTGVHEKLIGTWVNDIMDG